MAPRRFKLLILICSLALLILSAVVSAKDASAIIYEIEYSDRRGEDEQQEQPSPNEAFDLQVDCSVEREEIEVLACLREDNRAITVQIAGCGDYDLDQPLAIFIVVYDWPVPEVVEAFNGGIMFQIHPQRGEGISFTGQSTQTPAFRGDLVPFTDELQDVVLRVIEWDLETTIPVFRGACPPPAEESETPPDEQPEEEVESAEEPTCPQFGPCNCPGADIEGNPDPAVSESVECVACVSEAGYTWLGGIGCVGTSPEAIFVQLIRITLGISGGIALLRMIYLGYVYQFGQDKDIKAARQAVIDTFGAIAVLLFSVLILEIIGVNILDVVPTGFYR